MADRTPILLFAGAIVLVHAGIASFLLPGLTPMITYAIVAPPSVALIAVSVVRVRRTTREKDTGFGPLEVGTIFLSACILWQPAAYGIGLLTGLRFPGIDLAIPIIATVVILLRRRGQARPSWLSLGRFDLVSLFFAIATVALSALGLWLWSRGGAASIQWQRAQLELIPRSLWIPGAIGFALTNAIAEEVIYRGVIREGLRSFVSAAAEIPITAALFGIAHLNGFPSGIVGVALVFVWGIALGIIRNRTDGILAPVVVHIAADLAIFTILATL